MTEPTMGELARRIDESQRRSEDSTKETNRRLDQLITEIRHDRQEMRAAFVAQAVYDADRRGALDRHQTLKEDVDEIKRERDEKEKSDIAFRRQVSLGLLFTGGGWLVTIVLFVVQAVTK